MRFIILVSLLACGGTQQQSEAETHSGAESEAAESEAAESEGAEGSESSSTESTEATDSASALSTTAEEASAICEELGLEEIITCAFREGSQALPGGAQADLIEAQTEDPARGETKSLVLVVRVPNDPDLTTTLELGEAYDVPGESVSYEVGSFSVDGDTLSLPYSNIATTYPNTGDPDEPTGEYTERDDMVARCTRDGDFWDCEKASR